MIPKKSKGTDLSALDSLMGEEVEESPETQAAEAAPVEKPAKGDPATVIAAIQAQLDELSSMLSMG